MTELFYNDENSNEAQPALCSIPFTKMQALGNDFVIINNVEQSFDLSQLKIRKLAHRQLGIGFDQLLVIEKSTQADFFCRIYNADGTEAEQCGNGLRCVAKFLHEAGLIKHNHFKLATLAGIFAGKIANGASVALSLGIPQIQESLIDITVLGYAESMPISIISIGNPHAIIKVDNVCDIDVLTLGKAISALPLFPNGTNVGFMQIISNQHIKLRTFERGVGQTYACGSNACAAAVAGIINGWLSETVQVEYLYGTLDITYRTKDSDGVHIIGPASKVFEGRIRA